jgi:prefoldin subunit 5
MPDAEIDVLRRENQYLKQRNAQLQADLTDVSAEAARLHQALEHTHARRAANRPPNPLGGDRQR